MDAKLSRTLLKEFAEQGLLKPSNLRGLATVTAEVAVFACIVFGLSAVETGGALFWIIQLLGGVSCFRWFVVLHECGHRTLFDRTWLNSIFGHLASVFCLIPYFPWRNVHILHHRWVGVIDKDPTQKDLLKLATASQLQNRAFWVVWKLWLPVPFAKFLFEVFWGYPINRARDHDRKNALLGLVSVLVCLVPHLGLIAWIGLAKWAYNFLPMLAVFYVLIENMNLPQHSELFPHLSDSHPDPVPLAQQDEITRSTDLPGWLSVCLALNFNRHTEHHLFPAAPWYRLNRIRQRMLHHGYQHPHEVQFVSFMWRLRRRDPLSVYRDSLPKASERKS